MDAAEIQRALDEVFDQALLYHAYTEYMRDYELIIYVGAAPSTGIQPVYRRYLFKHCVEVDVHTTVRPATWRGSLDDHLITHESGRELDGYVWGVNWQELYPGGQVVADSKRAARWTEAIGIPFHEIRVEANAHDIRLVAADLTVSVLSLGYAPFVVKEG
jgi:hypothetical protein